MKSVFEADAAAVAARCPAPEKLRGRTVLVTGAGGLLGSHLCHALAALNDAENLGIRTEAAVRNPEKARKLLGSLENRPDFRLRTADVCEPFETEGPADYIIHAASPAAPRCFARDPVGTVRANVEGTRNLLEFARRKGSRKFVFLSTREVYGQAPAGVRETDETAFGSLDPAKVRSCYPESKRLAETLCAAYARQFGVPTATVRLGHVYGPDSLPDDGRVWTDFVSAAVRCRPILLKSDGRKRLSFTYVSDAVTGILHVLLLGTEFAYNLADPDSVLSVRELAETLRRLYPERIPEIRYAPGDIPEGYLEEEPPLLKVDRLKALGWRPAVGIEAGLRRTVEHHLRERNAHAQSQLRHAGI